VPDIARRGGRAARDAFLEACGRAFSVKSAGAPDKPLLEALLVFAAFYVFSYVPSDPSIAGGALGQSGYYGLVLLELVPKALVLLYLMARSDGLAAFRVLRLIPADLYKGAWAAICAGAAATLPALGFSLLGWSNPLLESVGEGASPLLAPLILAASLAIGYGEELFFRVFLIKRLEQAGLPILWAALASTLAFGSAHGMQGLPGLIVASCLGAWFAWRWIKGASLHEIALGHALYDAAVMSIALYA